MEPKNALVLAIAAALAAVAVVAVDTAYGLEARLEASDEGEWRTVWRAPGSSYDNGHGARPVLDGCVFRSLRIVVDNDKPLPDTVDVAATYWNMTTGNRAIFEETWKLAAFEVRTKEFVVPEAAKPPPPREEPRHESTGSVTVYVEDVGTAWQCIRFDAEGSS